MGNLCLFRIEGALTPVYGVPIDEEQGDGNFWFLRACRVHLPRLQQPAESDVFLFKNAVVFISKKHEGVYDQDLFKRSVRYEHEGLAD